MTPFDEYDAAASNVAGQSAAPMDQAAARVVQGQKSALRSSLYDALLENPDMAARAQQLGKRTGLPADVVGRNMPEVERRARLDEFDQVLEGSPAVAKWLTEQNNARVAHDDAGNLSMLERAGRQISGGAVEAGGMALSGFGVGLNLLQRNILGALTDMLPTPRGGEMTPEARQSAIGPLLGQDFRMVGGGVKRFARNDIMVPAQQQTFMDQVGAGLGQVGGQILMAPFFGPAGLYLQGLDVMDEKVGGDNASQGAKDLATVAGAVVTGVTEKWALDKLLGPVADNVKASLAGALARIGVAAASEGAQEATESIAQDLLRQQLTNPDAEIQLAGAAQEGGVGATVGGIVRGIVEAALHVRTRHVRQEQQAQQSEAHAKVLGELATLAEASKVRGRDPEAFATFMQSLTEEGVPNVYVDAKALLQAVDINEVANVLPSVAEQIEQAAATGGDVVIPTAELLTAGSGQTFMQTLVDNARTAPEAMSPVEAREYMQAKGDQLAADIQTALGQQEQDQSWRQMRDDLRDEFKGQLDGVKRFTADVNLQYANLLANFYAVTAAKLGQTPQELATRYGLRVQSRGVEGGQVLDQVLPDFADMRAKVERQRADLEKLATNHPLRRVKESTLAKLESDLQAAQIRHADVLKKLEGSKLVDAKGNPMVVYHGGKPGIAESGKMKRSSGGRALWFSDASVASTYAGSSEGATLYPVFPVAENPMEFDAKGATWQELQFEGERVSTDVLADIAEQRGFDALVIRNLRDADTDDGGRDVADHVALFNPEQVVSATSGETLAQSAGRPLSSDAYASFQGLEPPTRATNVDPRSMNAQPRDYTISLPPTIEIDGKQRPTTNSNGQPIAQTEEGVRNFWKWFGDSKVVDTQGRPLVVYHGSRAQFEVFDFGRIGQQGRAEGAGFYFTKSQEIAAGYGTPMAVYLSVGKPLPYAAKGFSPAVLQKLVKRIAELEAQAEGMEIGDGFLANFGDVYTSGLDKVVKEAARLIATDETALDQLSGIVGSGVNPEHVNRATIEIAGFDGVVADGFSDSGDEQNRIFVAFTPEQIKSATGNNGEFDPANPSILRQEARGSINLPDDLTRSPAILSLFAGADLSTFIHESGHFFLEVQMDLAARILAKQQEATAQTTVDVVKRKGTDSIDVEATLAKLPPVAEGFARLFRGESPTTKFADVFDASALTGERAQHIRGKRYTTDIKYADYYRSSYGSDATLHYVDVPQDVAQAGKVNDYEFKVDTEAIKAAALSEGERSIVNDANILLTWFGIKGSETTSQLTEWFALDLEGKRPHHEKFARGFEAYGFEGNAPSLELQSMFRTFRAWMLSVYKELKALRVELTDDVRGVMDRMLASTQAIQEAEAARRLGPLFKTAEDAGMSLDDFRAYHALATDASQAAIEELQARGLRDMKWLEGAKDRKLKELQKLHDSLRREVRAEVRREVMSQPVYRAWQFLTGKGEADETAQAPDKPKASKELDVINDDLLTAVAKLGGLAKEQAVTVWGIDPKEKPDSGVFGTPVLRANGGLSIDAMAERLLEAGYLLPDEDGRHDTRDFEDRFNAALRGESIYSLWHDYKRPDDDAPVQALPEGIAFGKLDTAELERRYGNKPDAPWRKLQKLRMTSGARGLHPDVVAEVAGRGAEQPFTSGDQLVKALLDAEPPQSVIEGMTSQRMLERFGDLGTPEGLQRAVDRAIHNEVRARLLSTEIAALERGMQVRRDTGEVNAKGQRVTVDIMAQVAKQQAERIVGGTKVKNLRPSQYTTAETRAAKAAERAMLAGNTEEALAEKRHQLINLQAARAATRAQEVVEKIASYLRRFNDKPKGLDADYYDQVAQLLERFDLARSTTLKQIAKRKTLTAWVESQREQGLEPEIPPELLDEANRTSYKDMTVDELRGLRDTVRQIEKLGRVKNTLLTAKQQRDFQAVCDLIRDSILENAGGRVADTRTPATRAARWFKSVEDFGAAHIKAATWARVFDGGKDGGPAWEYFIRPANEAADMETRMRAEATEKLHAILTPVIKAGRMDGKGQFFETINRSMNREQVFAMALNMGNEGNIQRLLDGEGWTVQQIEPVLATLSAVDWQAVQAVWDHFESYRPLIGAKERRIYGKEPAWVDPMPLGVRTADGQTVQLRGGYYPVKYDPLANNRAEQHADAEDAKRQMQAAYTSATTRRGFTKSRAEAVKGRPLLYSLAAVYSGTQDVIHDLAFHEWLIDVNKLLRSDKINDAIRETHGPAAVRQLKTWIEDTARGEQGLQAEMDSMLGRLRQGVSIAGLGFNVMSAAIQPIGLTQSVVRVGGKWIGRGVAQYLANPLGKAREVNERSEFMASRARTRFRELNELRNQVEGEHPVRTWVSNGAFYLMTRMQMAVDVPTWLGAYEKAISEGNSDERAGQLADQAVIDSQGGGQMKDLSAIERGGPAQKLFTVFYSFMNTALNIGVAQTMTEKSKAKLVADYLLLYSVPAVLTAALKDALMPGDSGDWEDLDKILRKLLEAQLDNLFGLMVGVREVAGAAKMALGLSEYGRDYQGPAGLRLLSDITGLGKEIGEGELDDGFRKRAINVMGSAFGLPAAQANRTITGAQALIEGETENPAALAFGYQKP